MRALEDGNLLLRVSDVVRDRTDDGL